MNIPILQELQNLASAGGFQIVDDLGGYVSALVGLILIIASVAAFIYLVWGGLRWITAGTDKGNVEAARTTLSNALIGLTIVAASWAVFLILNYFFGLGIAGGSSTGSSPSSGSSTQTTCAGGIPIGSCGNRTYNANPYRCLAGGSTCPTTNSSYSYPFLCPDSSCP